MQESGEPQAAEVTDEELDNLLSRNPTKDKHILYLKDKDTTAACMHEDGVIAAFQQCLASWFGKDVSEVLHLFMPTPGRQGMRCLGFCSSSSHFIYPPPPPNQMTFCLASCRCPR